MYVPCTNLETNSIRSGKGDSRTINNSYDPHNVHLTVLPSLPWLNFSLPPTTKSRLEVNGVLVVAAILMQVRDHGGNEREVCGKSHALVWKCMMTWEVYQ